MNISALGLIFGLLLLAIPLYIIYYFKLNIIRRFCMSFCRMVIAVAVMAVIAWGAIKLQSIAYDIVVFFLLVILSVLFTLGRAKLNASRLFVPVALGTFVGVAVITFYGLFLIMGQKNPFVPHLFVPFAGIIAGSIVGVNAKALQTYYSGLLHHNQLYNYLLGNGSTHKEAVSFFVRRSLKAAVVMVSKKISQVVFVSSPVLLFAMVMGGADVFTSAAFQVLFFVAVISSSLISLIITLFVARKYSFDEYERLKPVVTAKTSSNLSEYHDTDSANPQQAESLETHPSE